MLEGTKVVKVRDIQRCLSKKQNQEIPKEEIAEILAVLDRAEREPDLFDKVVFDDGGLDATRRTKIELLERRAAPFLERWGKRERWRNQKRLTRLLNVYRSHAQGGAGSDMPAMEDPNKVVSIGERHVMIREAS